MEGAQCFIEVFKIDDSLTGWKAITPLINLRASLHITEKFGFKTIAVWYIKTKVKSL